MRIVNHADLLNEEVAFLEYELPEHQNLNELMKWALSHPKKIFVLSIVADVIVQDEFTHVIVPYRDGLVLVYDAT
jgi:hypothetical protein